MTDLSEKIIEAGAQSMRNSKAWPVVFSPGSAELLTRSALLAVLPMVAEEVKRIAEEYDTGGFGEWRNMVTAQTVSREVGENISAVFSSLIEDLK